MSDDLQGGGVVPSATAAEPQGGNPTPASATSVDLSAFRVDPSADPASASPNVVNGAGQGAPPQDAIATPDEIQRQVQAGIDKERARLLGDLYRKEQELTLRAQMIQQQGQPQQTPGQQTNPHDPNTNWAEFIRWEVRNGSQMAAQEAARETSRLQMESLMQMAKQNAEQQWIQSHPGVDIFAVKMYNRTRGIPEDNLDVGYELMTMPQNVQRVAQQTQQQTIQSFRQPQSFAQPVRGQNTTAQPQTFDFKKLLEAAAQDPSIIEALPEADRNEFRMRVAQMSGLPGR